jgi:hypothetical protein
MVGLSEMRKSVRGLSETVGSLQVLFWVGASMILMVGKENANPKLGGPNWSKLAEAENVTQH